MTTSLDDRALNPFPWYRQMRQADPVHFNPSYNSWQVFRYEDVQKVLTDWTNFSSQFGGSDPISSSLISLDPPRHRQMRNLVTLAFTPRAVAQLADRIEVILEELLAPLLPTGQLDVIGDLAYPLPVIVIAELLGIPSQDRQKFKHWSDALVGADSPVYDPQREMSHYFIQMIEQRRREPRNDLISDLLQAEIDGQHLTPQELLGFCILLLVAGNETTTNLIGNAFLCFAENPEVMDQLRKDPSLVPAALEEVLRYLSPVQHMYRRTIKEVEIDGRILKAGQGVVAWIGSANRDEAQFPDPDRFDLARNPKHLAFGHGIHFCLGAPLARLEAKIAVTRMLGNMRNIRRDTTVRLEAIGSNLVYGVKQLPIKFE
ncbi:MAG: cytochrome P450 [Chloroflexi bacterium]|nr:cytochrome P450 [Chloroflexota bacterium]OJW04339.1 MAG: cytochrome [Chloroflexi bacterium 54-19]